jgi:tight adherence protein C
VFVLLAQAATVAPAWAAETDLQVVDVRTDSFPRVVVRLNVTVDEYTPTARLTPDQIRVVEDGRPQPLADVFQIRSPLTPASIVVAIDVSGSMAEQDRLPQARAATRTFLNQIRRSDRVALLSFASDIQMRQSFTSDRRLLGRAIDGLATTGNTRLYDGLDRAVTHAMSAPSGSRAVILLTDGEDTESISSVDDGIAMAARSGTPVYTIGLGNEVKADVLQRISAETGGRFYQAPSSQDLARVFLQISRQLTSQYELFWISRIQGDPGREVPVQISFNRPSAPESSFSYRVPNVLRGQAAVASIGSQELALLPPVEPPSEGQILLLGLLAALTVGFIYTGLVQPKVKERQEQRMATYVAGQGALAGQTNVGARRLYSPALAERAVPVSPLVALFARIAARILPNTYLERLRKLLIQAGLPTERHFWLFLAAELGLAVLLSSAAYAVVFIRGVQLQSPLLGPLLIALMAFIGLYLPFFWLRRRVAIRQRALLRALPDALDLMAIGVSAGLSVDGAMLEVVEQWEGVLSRELNQVLNEMRLGVTRRRALLGLAERTQLEDIRLLVAALIQSEDLGSEVSETLKIQAEQLRIRRRQRAEEQARKAPVKMLIPMVGLIFPALFVVLLGPAGLTLIRMFRGLNSGG